MKTKFYLWTVSVGLVVSLLVETLRVSPQVKATLDLCHVQADGHGGELAFPSPNRQKLGTHSLSRVQDDEAVGTTSAISAKRISNYERWPFYAFLETPTSFCSAIIIGPNRLLTAASCVFEYRYRPKLIRVVVGVEKKTQDLKREQSVKALKICYPSDFRNLNADERFAHKDYAMIKSEKFTYNDLIQPIKVWTRQEKPYDARGSNCVLLGRVSRNPPNLAISNIVKRVDCTKEYKWDLCLRTLKSNHPSGCKDDRGGAIACKRSKDDQWWLVGVMPATSNNCSVLDKVKEIHATEISHFLNSSWSDCEAYLSA